VFLPVGISRLGFPCAQRLFATIVGCFLGAANSLALQGFTLPLRELAPAFCHLAIAALRAGVILRFGIFNLSNGEDCDVSF
jgi:predicted benzoate:H+ symporter BenE